MNTVFVQTDEIQQLDRNEPVLGGAAELLPVGRAAGNSSDGHIQEPVQRERGVRVRRKRHGRARKRDA